MDNSDPLGRPVDAVNGLGAEFLENLYERWRENPESVDPQWQWYFRGFELAADHEPIARPAMPAAAPPPTSTEPYIQVGDLIHSYRELGHMIANLDPLGHNETENPMLELDEFGLNESDLDRMVNSGPFGGGKIMPLRQLIALLRQTYCGTFAVEYMDIRDMTQRTFLQEHMEPTLNRAQLSNEDRKNIMARLIAAEDFELFLQRRHPTVKRFSIEGAETLITLMDELVELGANLGMDEMVTGMAHRGRLNVLAHILHKPYEMILAEVMDRPQKTGGDGDVKYHLGYACDHTTASGKNVHLSLSANPSHLEVVDPVVEGIVRAKQNRKADITRQRVVPVLIHGDAAFTGQGIVAETLYMSELEAYRTGGTIHIIVNNQIGFTTEPGEVRFTRYPSDVAKAIQAPVFHVNGDDPEAVVHAARLAMDFRQRFKADVIIDLVCYRRRGHNEMDDPSVTQPVMYAEIAKHPTVRQLYATRLKEAGLVTQSELDEMSRNVHERLEKAHEYAQTFKPTDSPPPVHGPWKDFVKVPREIKDWRLATGVPAAKLLEITEKVCRFPEGFNVHPKVAQMYKNRLDAVRKGTDIDWGTAEMLSLGSLLDEGVWVRLTGQDVCRGTFSHRNAVVYDNKTGKPFVPLAAFSEAKSRFVIINTMLSELGILGFEYGFSSADPSALVIWEAQFGDFVNMAQPIVDQFLVSAESKWGKLSGLVMLLPHGYEGQGPEHSHARLERFLQLSAEDNIQVCNPTTPAQYFHLLRRQVLRSFRKPLIVMSPKSLLRSKLAVSTLDEFANAQFEEIIDEGSKIDRSRVRRVLMCSGKIYYELLAERTRHRITDIAILRLEQIYPFHAERLTEIARTYPKGVEMIWVQEEPRNNGVYPFIGAKLHYHWPGMQKLIYIGRKPSCSPAAGSHEQHVREQAEIIARALNLTPAEVLKPADQAALKAEKEPKPSEVEVTDSSPVGK
ncbi:MAG TPA: 2-oxoglutarate dehydrogenase E1 component [Phycisphaerae bacterium]|nr:2-oxoglutarate dehydrogenase E1 component [Phycisphaerae bacterium]